MQASHVAARSGSTGQILHRAVALTVAGLCSWAPDAVAQQANQQTAGSAETADRTDLIEEILVTAQKRSENLQDVPISIQAISAGVIESLGATSLQELERAAPGVSFGDNTAYGRSGIRGILDYSRNAGYDARVGVYVDGVYMGRSYMNNVSLLDVERVEILRGPQGTLFGKNTDAGAINVVTRKPSSELGGEAVAEYGNFEHTRIDGHVNVPISERVAASIAASKVDSEGYYENVQLGRHNQGVDHLSGRAQLRVRPDESWDINLSLDGQEYDDSTMHYVRVTAPGADPYTFRSPTDDYEYRDNYGATLSLNYTFANGYALVDIADYREARMEKYFNGQGGGVSWINGYYDDRVEQFSQELRLVSPAGERFDFVAGLYYFDLTDDQNNAIEVGPDIVIIPVLAGYANVRLPSIARVETKSYAAYFNGSYRFFEQLELSAGVRFTREEKTLDFSMLDSRGIILGFVQGLKDERTDEEITPKIALNYHAGGAAMLYASYSEGFKSGGWAADFVTNPQIAAGLGVKPEYAKSYEVGLKSTLWDERARFNLTVFREEITDFQVFQLVPRDIPGVGTITATFLTNSGEVTSEGIEIEAAITPLRGLTLSANAAWNDAYFSSYPGGGGSFQGQILDADDVQLPFAPKFKGYFAADYGRTLFSWANLIGGIGVTHQTKSNTDSKIVNPSLAFLYRLPDFTTVDARVGLSAPDGAWEVSLWSRNLTDEEYVRQATASTLGNFRLERYDAPRAYGIAARLRF